MVEDAYDLRAAAASPTATAARPAPPASRFSAAARSSAARRSSSSHENLRALSALLTYPTADLQAAVPAIRESLAEGLLPPAQVAALEPLLRDLETGDLYDLQERFVLLFDRSRTLSLNLFEHIHGESRDRGGAMVDLLETYRAGGFDLQGPELPDHLPVLLEFLSTRPPAEARAILAMPGISSWRSPNG
jgi:nitrate reductase molybdenum cofactor assembly chaperone NarJ/NarW